MRALTRPTAKEVSFVRGAARLNDSRARGTARFGSPWLGLSILVAICALFVGSARADEVRLSMSASSPRVQTGEPFAVQIRAELNGVDSDDVDFNLPDFAKFEVLGRRVSKPFSFSFGFGSGGQRAQMRSEVVYHFTLRAPAPGRFVIQPAVVTVGGRKFATRPLNIEVTGASLPQAGGAGGFPDDDAQTGPQNDQTAPPNGPLDGAKYDPEMFVRTVVDRTRAYIGEQVTVTIYLYVRGGLHETPMVTREATNEGFWVQDLLASQRALSATRQEVNGRVFSTYVLRRYAAFPMRAGKLEIGAPAVETSAGTSLFDLFNGPSPTLRRTGVPVTVDVSELPPRKADVPVHVGDLSLEASLDPASGKVGDAMTLRVVAKGTGNLRALKLEAPAIAGLDVLPPEVDDRVTTDVDRVGGQRTQRWLLLPRSGGNYVVPPFVVEVLDPKTGTYSRVQTQPLTLKVSGPSAPQATTAQGTSPQPNHQDTLSAADPRNLAPSFGPVRLSADFARKTQPLHETPWFFWALLLAPTGLLFVVSGRCGLRILARRRAATEGREQASRAARQQLAEARKANQQGDAQATLACLSQALKLALEARLKAPIGGFTRPSLRAHLQERGMAESLANSLVGQLDLLDQQRFAPVPKSASELVTLIDEVSRSLHALERFTPTGTP